MRVSRFMLTAIVTAVVAPTAYAHQPKMVSDTAVTRVDKPQMSQAFDAEFSDQPALYEIVSPECLDLYVNILVPDEVGITTDLSVAVTSGTDTIMVLDGPAHEWREFCEPFGGDSYLMGPEQRLRVGPGTYVTIVTRPGNEGRHVLAVTEREEFSFKEIIRIVGLMPRLKRDFFHKASIRALTDPVGSLFRRGE